MLHRPNQLLAPARPRRRGLIMPLVLLTLAVAVILGSCFLSSASTATVVSSAANRRLRARTIAESGLAMTLAYLESDANWRTNRTNGVWVTSESFDGGTFTASGEDGDQLTAEGIVVGDGNLADDVTDPVTITCVGVFGEARHLVRAVRQPPKASHIAVNERVEVKKTALLDSYNPDIGPYHASTATAKAVAMSNGALRQNYLKLRGTSRVNGNVYFGPGGSLMRSVQKAASATVTGTISSLSTAAAFPDVTEPAWPVDPTGVVRSHSSGVTILDTDLWCDRLDLTGTATLRIMGDRKIHVSGPMTVADDAKIDVGAPMAYGAAIKGTISIDSNYPMDSYDSSIGPYGGTNVGSNVMIATNATASGAVTVESPIKGNVYTGVGSTPATSIVVIPPGSVSGTRGVLTKPIVFPPPPPMPTDVPGNMGDYLVKDATATVASNMQTNNFSIEGNALLRVSGHRKVRVNGNFSFAGNGVIDIPADSSLSFYVAGSISITGNGFVANNSKSPPRLQFFALGSNPVYLGGNGDIYAIIDAPNAPITMTGNAVVYGAVMGASLALDGNAVIHNDRNPALVDTNPRLAAAWTTGSKLTLYTNNRLVVQDRARINPGPENALIATINHLGPLPMELRGTALSYAEVVVPETTLDISGAAQWNGRIRARDLVVGGTAVVTANASGGTTNPAILVSETVDLKDAAIVTGTGGTATLVSNGGTDYTIEVTETAGFKGEGYTSPGGNPNDEVRVAATASYTGGKTALAMAVPIAALTSPPASALAADRSVSGMAGETITGDVYCANFLAQDDAVVEVDGDTRLILTGNFQMRENARLVLRTGARLTVYCPGTVRFAGNVRVNVDGNPGRLTLSCPAAPEIEVQGTSKVSASVLAPLAQMKLADSSEFFGAFTGRRVKIDGAAKFHCSKSQVGPITWIEQQ